MEERFGDAFLMILDCTCELLIKIIYHLIKGLNLYFVALYTKCIS